MKLAQPLWLASRSPRRRLMLEEAGFETRVHPPDFDDALLRPGRVNLYEWVMALAALKAWRVADLVRGLGDRLAMSVDPWSGCGLNGTVIGADTMCVKGAEALGQPCDADDATRMLQLLRNAEHETITGVCMIDLATGKRIMFCDRALVRVGDLSESQVDQYVSSGDWRGKAGAYNLSERIHAGWPIECLGDPATVMGLPMQRLRRFTMSD